MTGSAFLLNIPPISFFAFQIEKSEPRGNVTKNRRFIKNSFDVLLLFRFKVGHQMTPNGKPSPKLKIPCANNTCEFDPHHRHRETGQEASLSGPFVFTGSKAPPPCFWSCEMGLSSRELSGRKSHFIAGQELVQQENSIFVICDSTLVHKR